MKLGTWLAVLGTVGCVSVGLGLVASSEGCTATVEAGGDVSDDGGSSSGSGSSSSSSSSGGTEDAGPATQIDAGNTPIDPCLECEYGLCSGLYSVCIGSPGCLAIYQCATAPTCAGDTTGTCVTNCINAQDTASQNLYGALGDCDYNGECNGGSCAATCNPPAAYCTPAVGDDGGTDSGSASEDAGTTTGTDASAPQTCQACQSSACTSALALCASGQPCGVYNQCVLGCTTATCTNACQTDNPPGYNAAQALGSCTTTNCPQCTQ